MDIAWPYTEMGQRKACDRSPLLWAMVYCLQYCIVGKFGELSVIRQIKTIQISTYN